MPPPNMDKAACVGTPEVFDFDEDSRGVVTTALRLCAACPVDSAMCSSWTGAQVLGFTGIAGGQVWRNGKQVRVVDCPRCDSAFVPRSRSRTCPHCRMQRTYALSTPATDAACLS